MVDRDLFWLAFRLFRFFSFVVRFVVTWYSLAFFLFLLVFLLVLSVFFLVVLVVDGCGIEGG